MPHIRITHSARRDFESYISIEHFSSFDQRNLQAVNLEIIVRELRVRRGCWPGAIPIEKLGLEVYRALVYHNIAMTYHIKRTGWWRWKTIAIKILAFEFLNENEAPR